MQADCKNPTRDAETCMIALACQHARECVCVCFCVDAVFVCPRWLAKPDPLLAIMQQQQPVCFCDLNQHLMGTKITDRSWFIFTTAQIVSVSE